MAGIFDKVVVGLTKGVDTVSENSKILVEKARLNTQIEEMDKKKAQLIQNLGYLVYNMQARGEVQIEQCEGICKEITSLNKQMEAFQDQIQSLEQTRTQTVQQQEEQQQEEQQETFDGVTCECGFTNKAIAKFCSKCGKPLVKDIEE